MIISLLNWQPVLADAAGTTTVTQANPTGSAVFTVLYVIVLVVIFYFIGIRPQSKKAKDQANLLKTLKPGDKVVTSSGIVGIVVSVKDDNVAIRSADSKLEVLKSAITDIREKASSGAAAE